MKAFTLRFINGVCALDTHIKLEQCVGHDRQRVWGLPVPTAMRSIMEFAPTDTPLPSVGIDYFEYGHDVSKVIRNANCNLEDSAFIYIPPCNLDYYSADFKYFRSLGKIQGGVPTGSKHKQYTPAGLFLNPAESIVLDFFYPNKNTITTFVLQFDGWQISSTFHRTSKTQSEEATFGTNLADLFNKEIKRKAK